MILKPWFKAQNTSLTHHIQYREPHGSSNWRKISDRNITPDINLNKDNHTYSISS